MQDVIVKEIIKKYNIRPYGDKIRVRGPLSEEESLRIIQLKPDILKYFENLNRDKEVKNREYLQKARAGEDGTFLTIELDIHSGVSLRPARRLNAHEKVGYDDWFKECGLVGLGDTVKLPHIKLAELPQRDTDGTFGVGGSRVWIITADEYDNYMSINDTREKEKRELEEAKIAAWKEKIKKAEQEKAELLAKVDSWDIKERTIYDEGGKTKMYLHCFRVGNKEYSYNERSLFDVGIVINPNYEIADGIRGGIAKQEQGVFAWYNLGDNGWEFVRPLTEEEAICFTIVARYGKYAHSPIRM